MSADLASSSRASEAAEQAIRNLLEKVVTPPAPEARALGHAVQGHINETLARVLNPEISFRLEIAPFVAAEANRLLSESRAACLTELRQCALDLQEAANQFRPIDEKMAGIFQQMAQRVRMKVAAAERHAEVQQ